MTKRSCLTLAILAALNVPLWAQAPAPAAPAGPPPGSVIEDENGYKLLAPYIDPKLKPADAGKLKIRENQARSFVGQVLSGALPLADNKINFDYYYQKMLFPSMTQTTDAALAELPQERHKLFRDHLERASGAVHAYLLDMVFTQMQAIVTDNYHPAVRYNAMLVISHLNDQDASRVGANKTTPEPMVRALPFIIEQFNKADNTDALKLAALIGLVRHLEWDNYRGNDPSAPTPAINPAQRKAIVDQLLKLAAQKDPPPGRNAAGHEWFRRRAIDGLTSAASVRADAEIAAAMETLLKDESESLAIRCAAASAVGEMAFQAPVKLEPKATAQELGYLALLACHKELTRVAELNKLEIERSTRLQSGSSYSGSYGGEEGGMTGVRSMPGGATMSMPGVGAGAGGDTGVYAGPRPGGSVRPRGSGTPDMEGGMMPGGAYGSYGGYGSTTKPQDPKQYRFDHIRRRIRAQIYAVETGLVGPEGFQKFQAKVKQQEKDANATTPVAVGGASNEPPPRGLVVQAAKADLDYVKKVITGVENLARAVEETKTDLADLDKELRKQMATLERTIGRKVAVVAPPPVVSDLPEAPTLPDVAPAPAAPEASRPAPPAAPEAPMPAAPAPAAPAPAAAATPPDAP